jgi:hypothetical protein
MSGSSLIIAVNALMLKRLSLPRALDDARAKDASRNAGAGMPVSLAEPN